MSAAAHTPRVSNAWKMYWSVMDDDLKHMEIVIPGDEVGTIDWTLRAEVPEK